MKQLDNSSIDCCISSPPYWNLRDYGIEQRIWDDNPNCDHIWSDHLSLNILKEPVFCVKCGAWYGVLGLEPTFELYIKHLCDIYDQVKRVLKKSGTCWVNLGDTYGGSGNSSGHTSETKNLSRKTLGYGASKGNQKMTRKYAKCLLMIPQRFAIEMINRGWILRNVIIWQKPNPMPSSARDRFTVDFEYVYFFVKNKKYWFEQQKEKLSQNPATQERYKYNVGNQTNRKDNNIAMVKPGKAFSQHFPNEFLGKNKRTVWNIPTRPNPESHFATFPPKLVKPMIKAGCPEFICKRCGKPREKIIESSIINNSTENFDYIKYSKANLNLSKTSTILTKKVLPKIFKGYSNCGCNAEFESGIVLDPFAGTGTTLLQAWKLGRNYIGFEISKDYCKIANKGLSETKTMRLDNFIEEKIEV